MGKEKCPICGFPNSEKPDEPCMKCGLLKEMKENGETGIVVAEVIVSPLKTEQA
jgi:hypothetical protein